MAGGYFNVHWLSGLAVILLGNIRMTVYNEELELVSIRKSLRPIIGAVVDRRVKGDKVEVVKRFTTSTSVPTHH